MAGRRDRRSRPGALQVRRPWCLGGVESCPVRLECGGGRLRGVEAGEISK